MSASAAATVPEVQPPAESSVITGGRDAGLIRSVGTFGLLTTIINCVIGAGIFKLPAEMAGLAGPYAPFAYFGCAVGIGAVSVCFAEAGSRVPTSGGPYGPIDAALGPLIAFVAGVMLWLTSVLASGGIFAACVDAAGSLFPALAAPAIRIAMIVALVVIVTALNLVSVATTTKIISGATILKLAPLFIFLVVGVFAIDTANLRFYTQPFDASAFGRASVMALFAFTGMETALGACGEVRNPTRTVPRSILTAMAFITFVYIGIQFVAQGLMGASLATSAAPLADSLARVSSPLRIVVLIGMLISMFGFLCGNILGAPRVLFALARDGYLPAALGKVHPKSHVPYIAVIANAAVAGALALSGSFVTLAVLSTLAAAALYLLGCIAAVILRKRNVAQSGPPIVIKGMTAFAVIGVFSMLWLIAQGSREELLGAVGCIAVCVVYYAIVTRIRRAPKPAIM